MSTAKGSGGRRRGRETRTSSTPLPPEWQYQRLQALRRPGLANTVKPLQLPVPSKRSGRELGAAKPQKWMSIPEVVERERPAMTPSASCGGELVLSAIAAGFRLDHPLYLRMLAPLDV